MTCCFSISRVNEVTLLVLLLELEQIRVCILHALQRVLVHFFIIILI